MGGSGSGRRWHAGARRTTENLRSIDVPWMKRQGMLTPGAVRSITWVRQGKVVSSIDVIAEEDRIILSYRCRGEDGAWQEATRYPVQLTTTPCHLGGTRQWFLCPSPGCGRRVGVLYDSRTFACRHCCNLAYPSQREDAGDRAARKANLIRRRLGWQEGMLNAPLRIKPVGMHWATFARLCNRHDIFHAQAIDGLAAQLARLRRR
jgi:hypothetical protein